MLYKTQYKRISAKHITGLLARSYCGPSGSHIDRASLRNARPSSRRRAQASPRGLAHRAQASAYGAQGAPCRAPGLHLRRAGERSEEGAEGQRERVEEADGLHGDGEVGRGLLHPLHELQLLDEVPDPPGGG